MPDGSVAILRRSDVVNAARSWLGTRWRHGQATKGAGCDCLGLVAGVGLELGVQGSREWTAAQWWRGYGREPDSERIRAGCALYLDPVPVRLAGIGDILVFQFISEGQASGERHFAIVSRAGNRPTHVIHAYAHARKVAEMGIDGEWRHGIKWRSLIVSAWRYRGMVD